MKRWGGVLINRIQRRKGLVVCSIGSLFNSRISVSTALDNAILLPTARRDDKEIFICTSGSKENERLRSFAGSYFFFFKRSKNCESRTVLPEEAGSSGKRCRYSGARAFREVGKSPCSSL